MRDITQANWHEINSFFRTIILRDQGCEFVIKLIQQTIRVEKNLDHFDHIRTNGFPH